MAGLDPAIRALCARDRRGHPGQARAWRL